MLVRIGFSIEDFAPGVAEDLIASGRATRVPTGGVVASPITPTLVGEHACSLPVSLQEHATAPIQQTAVVPQKNYEFRMPATMSKSQRKRLAAQTKKETPCPPHQQS